MVEVAHGATEEEALTARDVAADAQARTFGEFRSWSSFQPLALPAFHDFSFVVLEEELDAVCREVTDLQRRLGEVEDQREALEMARSSSSAWWSRGRLCGSTSSTPSPTSFVRR